MTLKNLPRADIASRPGLNTGVSDLAMKRWVSDVRAETEDDATISIMEVIGRDFWGDGVTLKRINAALRQIGDRDVTVKINSPGGDYFEGLAIYNALRDHKGSVTVKILGIAASAASVIAMAGDRIEIGRAGFLMIHNAWVCACGDRNAMREVAEWLEPFDAAAVSIYAARTGFSAEELTAMLDRETWIGGKQAVDDGWADAFLPADEAVTSGGDEGANASIRAERRFDLIAAKAGVSNSERRALLADLKGGKPGAALSGTQDAAVISEVQKLLNDLKSL